MAEANEPVRRLGSAEWRECERIVARFEAARRRGEAPALADYLPAEGELRRAVLLELVHTDLELRLDAGETVRLEEYLRRFPELGDGEAILDLAAAEYALRRRREPQLSPAEYPRRFPQVGEGLLARLVGKLQEAPTIRGPLLASDVPPGSPPSMPGYEVLGELGRGGMGVVYQARHLALNRVVALKMILAGAHAGPTERVRFLVEAEVVAALRHPGIVTVYEIGTHDGLPFFALEYCPGGSLEKRARGAPLPPREAAAMVEKVARAVQAAHDKGVIHRDLKPANVLLDEHGEPKVTDFGLARRTEAGGGLTETGAVLGTPSYMAPEQARGKRGEVGPAADVWALGAVLYELLTGQPPFRAATTVDILLQVLEAEPAPPRRLRPDLPRDLETICLKCLQKDPCQRYVSARALAQDLESYLAGESIRARPVGRLERLWRWGRRKPALAAAVACAALAVLVVAVLLYQGRRADHLRQAEKRQEVMDRALLAALAGDLDGAEAAVTEAELLGASSGEVCMLRGQVALHRGDTSDALRHLDEAVRLLPDSVAAWSMLAMACYHSTDPTRLTQVWQQLEPMTPRTPEDFLFKGQVESLIVPEKSHENLDVAIARRDSVIARAVRAEARAQQALFSGKLSAAEDAIKDAEVAERMLPDNVFVLRQSVKASLIAACLYEGQGLARDRERVLQQCGRQVEKLRRLSSSLLAIKTCFWYYDYIGDEASAYALNQGEVEYRRSLVLYRRRQFPQALAAADRSARQKNYLMAWIERGFILAELPDGKKRARAAYHEAAARLKPFLGGESLCAPMILLFLGEKEMARKASREIDPARVPTWHNRWYFACLDYNRGRKSAEELLKAAGAARPLQCEAHLWIGLHYLADGDRDGAKKHFRLCVQTRAIIYWDYYWAGALLERLKDPSWPKWVPARK